MRWACGTLVGGSEVPVAPIQAVLVVVEVVRGGGSARRLGGGRSARRLGGGWSAQRLGGGVTAAGALRGWRDGATRAKRRRVPVKKKYGVWG